MTTKKQDASSLDPIIETKKSKKTIEMEMRKERSPEQEHIDTILSKAKPRVFVADKKSEVFTQDYRTKLMQEISYISPVMQDFISAFQNSDTMTAKVIGVRTNEERGTHAIANYGSENEVYQVLIPFSKFTDLTEEDLERININEATFLERRIGTTIDFIPEEYDKVNDMLVFIGNRVSAMAKVRREMWYSREVAESDERMKFQVGSLVEARVVGVYPKLGIGIELFGVESIVPLSELSYKRIRNDLSSLSIRVGDVVRVKITDLKRSEEYPWEVRFRASIKQAMPDPRLMAFNMINIGDKYKGVVSMIQENREDLNRSRIFIDLENNGEAICNFFDYRVKPGSIVTVKVKKKYMLENGEPRIKVSITHVETDPRDPYIG